MESSYLKTFVEVVQTGSFTKAAENLFISQSAVSRRIQHMEKEYKCSLLDRTDPHLKPTEKGQMLLDKALKIMKLEQELKLKLELGLNTVALGNSLSFICTPTFGAAFLPQIMTRWLRRKERGADLTFHQDMPEKIREDLKRGAFEVAVIEHCPEFDLHEFRTMSLPGDELVFVAANNIEFYSHQPQLEELFAHSFLGCNSGCCTQVIFERNLQSRGYSKENFKQIIETSELDILLKSLLAGVGISFLPLVLVNSFVEKGQLKTYRFDDLLHYRNRSLVMPATAMECNLARRFAEEIITFFEESGPAYVSHGD
jgi:LysR family transcriptional regulator, transcriptional activator of the cysJI operon